MLILEGSIKLPVFLVSLTGSGIIEILFCAKTENVLNSTGRSNLIFFILVVYEGII
jgi:hypothetical protein